MGISCLLFPDCYGGSLQIRSCVLRCFVQWFLWKYNRSTETITIFTRGRVLILNFTKIVMFEVKIKLSQDKLLREETNIELLGRCFRNMGVLIWTLFSQLSDEIVLKLPAIKYLVIIASLLVILSSSFRQMMIENGVVLTFVANVA